MKNSKIAMPGNKSKLPNTTPSVAIVRFLSFRKPMIPSINASIPKGNARIRPVVPKVNNKRPDTPNIRASFPLLFSFFVSRAFIT